MIIPVSGLGQVGILTDGPKEKFPLNAWTAGRNVRFHDGAVEKMQGHIEVYATPLNPPWWLFPIARAGNYFWLYAGDTKVGATDGATHADITRVAGNYTTDLNVGWTGTSIEGIPVITNGTEVPQMWSPPALATKLIALTAWPGTYTCRAMKSLKRYLVALFVIKAGVQNPYMIKWSHQAPTNGVPASWDETDPTIDAGEWTLPTDGGFIVDGAPLRDDLIIYKEYQTWKMQYAAGVDIFRFTKAFDSFGAVSRRCAVEFFTGRQLVFTGDDIVLHDSQQAKSLINERLKTALVGTIDTTYFARSFVVINYAKFEVWVCFPETGQSSCTKALVWNWINDTWGFRDLPNTGFIAAGIVSPIVTSETWAGAVGTWADDPDVWGDRSYDPTKRQMLMAAPVTTKLHQMDQTQQADGVNMVSFVERQSLGFPLKSDQPPDFTRMKQINTIWPQIKGTVGGVVNIYLGTQKRIDGPVVYSAARPYTIGTTEFIDTSDVEASRMHALKFESTSNVEWKLGAYDADVVDRGIYYG